jgi:hypothetical protein
VGTAEQAAFPARPAQRPRVQRGGIVKKGAVTGGDEHLRRKARADPSAIELRRGLRRDLKLSALQPNGPKGWFGPDGGPDHLIFDVPLPYKLRLSNDALCRADSLLGKLPGW